MTWIRIGKNVVNVSAIDRVELDEKAGVTRMYINSATKPVTFKKYAQEVWKVFKGLATTNIIKDSTPRPAPRINRGW